MTSQIATSPASIEASSPAEASAHLVSRFFKRKDDLIASLSSGDFYIEIFFILAAILAARLLAAYLQHRVKARFEKNPPKFIDAVFITKPLSLLTPVVALLLLTAVKLVFDAFVFGSGWIEATIQLCTPIYWPEP